MKAAVVSLDGKKVSDMELPEQFSAQVDEPLIRRAVLSIQSASVQTKYPWPMAGRYNTATYIGSRGKPTMHRTINVGHARKPRLKNRRGLLYGQVAGIPGVMKGPKAHPPKAMKIWAEKINRQEKRKATESAIAATGKAEIVKARGHLFSEKTSFPIVVETKLEELAKTSEVRKAFEALGIWQDVEKAQSKRKVRAGKGKKRGRRYKDRKSILVVAADTGKIFRGARNIYGVDVVRVREVNADALAPGGSPGRLTVWTEKAVKELAGEGRQESAKADSGKARQAGKEKVVAKAVAK